MRGWTWKAWRAAMVVAWAVSIGNAIPAFHPFYPPGVSTLSIGIAVAGLIVWALQDAQRPVDQVFEAGREYGRREAILEASRRSRVVSLEERRRRREEGWAAGGE